MKKRLLQLLTIGLPLIVGCGGGDLCSRPSPCINDVMSTPAAISQCKATLDANRNAPCYKEVIAFGECALSARVCNAGGVTDSALTTTKVENNCRNQSEAGNACCAGNPGSSACN